MAALRDILKAEIRRYGGRGGGINLRRMVFMDDEQQFYGVLTVPHPQRTRPANVMVMAQVVGEWIVIEEDRTDKPFYEALMRQGIPRQQIILAYQGEILPDPVPQNH